MLLTFCVFTVLFLTFLQTAYPCTDCNGINVTCVERRCLPRCVHETSSGDCLQCWDSKFWGPQCKWNCPSTCLNSRCKLNNSRVECTEGCVAGKKGGSCEVNCPSNCAHCERYGDTCTEPCNTAGHYSDNCDKPCIGNCAGGCGRNTGICDHCTRGYRGELCTLECPSVCTHCERHGEKCTEPCPITGYYGYICDKPCIGNCSSGCNRITGICDYCAKGYRGERCTLECPNVCTKCERYGHRCIGPCSTPHYFGDMCQRSCPGHCKGGCDRSSGECDSCKSGYTGKYCNVTCPTNCIDGCDKSLGECAGCRNGCGCVNGECFGCVAGQRGKFCDEICPSTCTECDQYLNICTGPCPTDDMYGDNCSIPCPHACNGCDKDTGVCKICAAGYSRTYCDEMCSKCMGSGNQCNSNKCTTRDPHLLLKVIFGVLGVIVLTVIIFSSRKMFYKIRNRYHRAYEHPNSMVTRDQSDQSQYWATKYWEIYDEDLDSDPIIKEAIPAQRGRCPLPLQQRDERPSGTSLLQQDIPSQCRSKPDKKAASCHVSDEEFVLENHVNTSADAGAACAPVGGATRLSTSSYPTPDLTSCSSGEGRTLHTNNTCQERRCSVTSEDLRLTRKTESQIIMEQNNDFSKVYVKYVTPNILDDSSC